MRSNASSWPMIGLGFGFLHAASVAAWGQDAAATPDAETRHGDWAVTCADRDGKTLCAMSQKHFLKSNGRLAFSLEYAVTPGKGKKAGGYLIARAPLETYLLPGVQLKVSSSRTLRLPFEFCGADGCVATLQAPAQIVNAMKRGDAGTATFYTLNGRTIALPISLTGFTAAFNDMKARDSL